MGAGRQPFAQAFAQLAGGEVRFLSEPLILGLAGSLLSGAQGDVNLLQLDVDQLPARANALQLEIAVVGDDVFEITPESCLA